MFQDVPFRDDLPSFMTHEDVLEYLEEFSKGLPIRFNTTVIDVRRDGEHWKVGWLRNVRDEGELEHFRWLLSRNPPVQNMSSMLFSCATVTSSSH